MNRNAACIVQALACREKAKADAANRDYWVDEAIKWLERAVEPVGVVAVTFEVTDRLVGEETD